MLGDIATKTVPEAPARENAPCCGTGCKFWGKGYDKKAGKDRKGMILDICLLNGKARHAGEVKECWGWKPQDAKNVDLVQVPYYLR